jgi:CubicO group peptidase (beta-lactamase class C family)
MRTDHDAKLDPRAKARGLASRGDARDVQHRRRHARFRVSDVVARAKPIVDAAIGSLCTAAVVRVERRGSVGTYAAGTLCPDPSAGPDAPCTMASLFDLASLTKLATTAIILSLVRERQLGLNMPFRELVPDFRGGNKDRVTLRQVLTHTAGLAWWKSFWKEATSPEEVVWLAAREPLAQDIGEFRYSDLGYIMLTAGIANAAREPFRAAMRERVLDAVEARTCEFGPRPAEECAATEEDTEWRRKRLRGEVHDENAYAMGGVSGHAGLFGTAGDVAALMRVYRDGAVIGNELRDLARTEAYRGGGVRRGIGLVLRPPEGLPFFSEDAFGHTGFTGTSVWVDPAKDFTLVLLTNRVYFGRANDEELYRFRVAVYEALARP